LTENNHYKEITVIILIFEENTDVISKCIKGAKNFKVIIIDNSGNLLRKKQLEQKFKIFKYVLNKKNYGFSKGNNQGIRLCDTKYAFVLNPDCLISEENILKLLTSHTKYENCFIISPTLLDKDANLSLNAGTFPEKGLENSILNLEGDVCVDTVLGAAMLFKKKDILEVGLFDENIFIFYEDFELCRRIKNKQKSIIQVFDAKAYHVHGKYKSIRNLLKKTFIENYNMTFGELYYFFKINQHHKKYSILKKKLPNFIIKSIINLFLIRLTKSTYYFSKVVAFYKFSKLLNKNK